MDPADFPEHAVAAAVAGHLGRARPALYANIQQRNGGVMPPGALEVYTLMVTGLVLSDDFTVSREGSGILSGPLDPDKKHLWPVIFPDIASSLAPLTEGRFLIVRCDLARTCAVTKYGIHTNLVAIPDEFFA